MRAAAAVLLCLAALCTGGVLRDALRRRVRILSQMCLFLHRLRLCAHLRQPLGVLLSELAGLSCFSTLTFLPDCTARCRGGMPLPQAWSQAVAAFARAGRLSRQQGQLLSELIPTLAASDSRQLDALLDVYESQAREALEKAEETEKALGGLCVRVCGAAGLLLGILIL